VSQYVPTPQYAPPPQQYTPPAPQAAGATSQVVLVQPPSHPPAGYVPPNREPLTTSAFLGMFILQAIPLVGFILLLVWAFGDVNINKRSFARAVLLLTLVLSALSVAIFLIFGLGILGLAAINQ